MKVLVVDMTHGGFKIASEFSKLPDFSVWALDIYKTLNDERKDSLKDNGIEFVENDFLERKSDFMDFEDKNGNKNGFMIVAPIHCNIPTIHMTHHEAVGFLLQDEIHVPVIEVTGVKGKTSVVWMLKEIFRDINPLVLSSLGVEVIVNGKINVLDDNISITPASIIEAWQLAENYKNIGICIFETSLGGTGLADVGILTNIAEDYSIADGRMRASHAKAQIFKNKFVACDFKSFSSIYSKFSKKTNTFSVEGHGNVRASNIKFGLYKTVFDVEIENLKTVVGEFLNTSFQVSTFAPAPHHVNNVLSAICASLTLNAPIENVKSGLKNFRGIKGRTSVKKYDGSTVIEEINPGINITTIKKSVEMIKDLKNPVVIFGGEYGVTCEEIDEEAAANFLSIMDEHIQVILTGEIGANLAKKIKRDAGDVKYIADFDRAIYHALKNGFKTILLIYRSDFRDVVRR